MTDEKLPRYQRSLAGAMLAARESVMRPLRPELRQAGLTDPQWRVLRVLNDDGELEPSRLADAALLHAPSVTRILRELRQRKLVERRLDKSDGRKSRIKLTADGVDLVRRTSAQTLQQLRLYEDVVGRERLDRLREELLAVVDLLQPLQPSP